MKKVIYLSIVLMSFFMINLSAQTFVVKTDLLKWGTASLNIEPELKIGKKSTLSLGLSWNPWVFKESEKNMKWKHFCVQPEYRYWFCNVLEGHFIGIHPFYTHFNAGNINLPFGIWDGLDNHRYQGNLWGAGIGYGYQWILGKRWSMEAEVGLGFGYVDAYKYCGKKCGLKLAEENRFTFMPTKVSLSFVYIIK